MTAVAFETPAPLPVEQMLLGRPAAEAAELLPRLFALCRSAQSAAARLALGLGLDAGAIDALERDIRRDHAAFLGVILPRALGLPVLASAADLLGNADEIVRDCADFDRFIGGSCPIAQLLREILRRFPAGSAATGVLPLPDPQRMTSCDPIENTVAAWHRPSPVLSHVSARFGRGPLWRVLARVLALSSPMPAPVMPRQGVAIVPASRGLYAVEAAAPGGRVARFRRWTPTGHLLAPGGILARALETCPPGQEAALLAVLDPCQPVILKEPAHA
ncbi:hypothetical protein [Poseidonocella sp. HB161398]|uniref:hypothetical protein n=1 Tax=Poseidonocella sp. HB161398 TaxID=2320855 RepID=UPI00110A019F|nr:hypothetical protein [Poseidonocella sp. HB161398]